MLLSFMVKKSKKVKKKIFIFVTNMPLVFFLYSTKYSFVEIDILWPVHVCPFENESNGEAGSFF